MLANPAGGVKSRFGGRPGSYRGRAGACGQIRLPARAGVQQFLPSVPGAGGTGSRAQSFPALDDRLLPRATGAHARHPRYSASGVHVADWSIDMLLALDVGNTNITIGIF